MKLLASMTCALTLAACSTNDSNDTTGGAGAKEFQLKIENIAPWHLLKVSSQSTIAGTMVTGNITPGQAYEVRFTAGPGQYLTFATTLIESNDWFFAPEPQGIPLYVDGKQLSGDVTSYVRLWDAGTELNQELGVGNATCGNQPMRDYGAPDPDSRVRMITETTNNGQPIPAISSMIRATLAQGTAAGSFVLRIENWSTDTTLQTTLGTRSIRLSPVAWAVSRNPNAFFDVGSAVRPNGLGTFAETGLADSLTEKLRLDKGIATALGRGVFLVHRDPGPLYYIDNADYGQGLESLVEDGDESSLLANLRSGDRDSTVLGSFDTPVGATGASDAVPGQSFEFKFKASQGDMLAIATSFRASNDWFFGSPMEGIPLFLGDFPRWEDITPDLHLYDLGTEADEELDVGLNVGTQQTAPNMGRPDGTPSVREVTGARYAVPVNQHIRVTLTPTEML
ncbi:MAG TPA: spondin domain-containing protein [Kofleriaceae bacterium]